MKHILFICTGNTCRSPLAENLLRHKAPERYQVKSAGIAAYHGQPASQHVQALLLKEKGLRVQHQAQVVTTELIEWADLILTMTSQHAELLMSQFPGAQQKISTFRQYVDSELASTDIIDPFGGSEAIYRLTLDEIEALLDRLILADDGQNSH